MRRNDDFDADAGGGAISDQIKTAAHKNKWPLMAVGAIVLVVIAVVLA